MFHLVVLVCAKSDADVGPIADALSRMRPLCLAEPGCEAWEAYHSEDDPRRFVLVERWETRELWDEHGALAAIRTIYEPEVLPRVTREVHPSYPV